MGLRRGIEEAGYPGVPGLEGLAPTPMLMESGSVGSHVSGFQFPVLHQRKSFLSLSCPGVEGFL